MHPYCVYVFDSSTANEAAAAVKDGQYDSIIQYHSSKHQQRPSQPPQPSQQPSQQPPQPSQQPPPQMQAQLPPQQQQQQPPPQQQQVPQQPYDPNTQKNRESKLNRLTQLAALATPPPLPPSQQQQTPDPLLSMQAMSECPNMEPHYVTDRGQHTVHHHP